LVATATQKLKKVLASICCWTIEIVKRSDAAEGFKLLPRRWVVERTIAWLNRNRRLAKDFANAEAWLMIASVKLLARRLVRA
jgi:transposase